MCVCVCVCVYIYKYKYYSAIKNNAICSNIDEPRDYHTKWSKSNKYHMISLICGILKNDTNERIYKTEIDS